MSLWKVIPKHLCVNIDLNDLKQFGFFLVIREGTLEIYRYAKS